MFDMCLDWLGVAPLSMHITRRVHEGPAAEEAVGVILVVDATKPGTFDRARQMLTLTSGYALPLVVAANFTDLEEALNPDQVRERLELQPDVPVVPTVAVRGAGAEELLEILFELLMSEEGLLNNEDEEGG